MAWAVFSTPSAESETMSGSSRTDKGRDSGGGGDGDMALVHVDVAVPTAAPDLCGWEHASATAHVVEGSLAGTVRTCRWEHGG